MARLIAQAGKRVGMAAWKVPDVAGIEVVDFRAAERIQQGGPDTAFQHESPFRRRGVPMQLPRHARLEAHRDAGDALGDRQLRDGRFFAETAVQDFALGLFQGEFECRQLLSGEERIGDVVLEGEVTDVAGLRHRWSPGSNEGPLRLNVEAARGLEREYAQPAAFRPAEILRSFDVDCPAGTPSCFVRHRNLIDPADMAIDAGLCPAPFFRPPGAR